MLNNSIRISRSPMLRQYFLASSVLTRELCRVYPAVGNHPTLVRPVRPVYGVPHTAVDVPARALSAGERAARILEDADLAAETAAVCNRERKNSVEYAPNRRGGYLASELSTRRRVRVYTIRAFEVELSYVDSSTDLFISHELAEAPLSCPLDEVALRGDMPVLALEHKSVAELLKSAMEYFGRAFTYEIIPQSGGAHQLRITDVLELQRWVLFNVQWIGWRDLSSVEPVAPQPPSPAEVQNKRITGKINALRRGPSPEVQRQERKDAHRAMGIYDFDDPLITLSPEQVIRRGSGGQKRRWVYVGTQSAWGRKNGESVEDYRERLNRRIRANRVGAIEAMAPLATAVLVVEPGQSSIAEVIRLAARWAHEKVKAAEKSQAA